MSPECYRIGNVILSAGTQEVTREGKAIPMPPLSFSLLLTLARHAPNVVTTAQLEQEVWRGLVVDRGTINKRVLLVRNALREGGCEQDYIVVVRGTGYRIGVPVEPLGDGQGDATRAPLPAAGVSVPPTRSWWGVAGAVALIVLAAFITFGVRQLPETSAARPAASAGTPPGEGSELPVYGQSLASIAVLPFADASGNASEDFLGEGIAREVAGLLAAMEGLTVAASGASFGAETQDLPLAALAAQLGVRTILRGSVRRFDDQLHVMADLLDARSGRTLWSESYDRGLEEVYTIQDDIASQVAEVLMVAISETERPDSRRGASANVEAFTLFLKGRTLIDSRLTLGADGLRAALAEFTAAVEADPGFTRAHVGIASVHLLLPFYDRGLDPQEYHGRAEASARFALELDASDSEAVGVLAAIHARRGDFQQAAVLFQRALELGTTDSNVLHWHALLFTSMGYFEDLVGLLDNAHRLDPFNPLLGCSLAYALGLSGRPEAASLVLEGMTPFAQRDLALAMSRLYLGEHAAARELLRDLPLRAGALPARWADLLVDAFEDPQRFQQAEDALFAASRSGQLPPGVGFEALLILGSTRAFDLELERAGTPFQYGLPETVWNNWGVALRQDPRFKDWVRELGYDQYWRRYGWPDRCKPVGLTDFECV